MVLCPHLKGKSKEFPQISEFPDKTPKNPGRKLKEVTKGRRKIKKIKTDREQKGGIVKNAGKKAEY